MEGESSENGFTVAFRVRGTEWRFSSRNHFQDISDPFGASKLIGAALALPLTMLMIYDFGALPDPANPLWGALRTPWRFSLIAGGALLASYLFTVTAYYIMRLTKTGGLAEWHACEHQAIGLILEAKSPNVENLKLYPRISATCGSVWAFATWQFLFWPWLLFYLIERSGQNPWWLNLVVAGLGTSSFLLFWTLYEGGVRSKFLAAILLPFLVPSLLLPLLLQSLFLVRKPSEVKLGEAADAVRRFLDENPAFIRLLKEDPLYGPAIRDAEK